MKKLPYSIKNRHNIKIDYDDEDYCIYFAGIHSGKSLICNGLACNHIYDTSSLKSQQVNIFFYSAIYQYHSFIVLEHYLNQIKPKLQNCCVLELDFEIMILKYINDSLKKRQKINNMNHLSFVQDMCSRHIYSYYQTMNFLQKNNIQYRTLKISDLKLKEIHMKTQFKDDIDKYNLYVNKDKIMKLDYEWSKEKLFSVIEESAFEYKKVKIYYTLKEIENVVNNINLKARELWKIK